MTLEPYRAAQLQARAAAGSLTAAAARAVQAALDRYVAQLTTRLAQLPGGTPAAQRAAAVQALAIARQANADFATVSTNAMKQSRAVAFDEILAIWQHAGVTAARTAGVPNALLGAVQAPNLLMAGQFASLGGVHHLKSLTASAAAAHEEIAALTTAALTSNVSPQTLARRLRPYMSGAEEFERAFPRRDEQLAAIHQRRAKLPRELQGAAGRLQSNALRVAYSEVHNARAEAELQAFAVDPVVGAVRWTLSPFRGSQTVPDICDALARNDFYGLGAGVYPLDAVPLSPHPRYRCERVPVTRPPAQWGEPRAVGVPRTLSPERASVSGGKGAPKLTTEQARRVRAQLAEQFRQLEQHGSPVAMRALIRDGDRDAPELSHALAAQRGDGGRPPTVTPPPPAAPPPPPPREVSRLRAIASGARAETVDAATAPGTLMSEAIADYVRASDLTEDAWFAREQAAMERLVGAAQLYRADSPSALEQVLRDGRWKTQHETGTSGGTLDPALRTRAEDAFFGVGRRPIYGYLSDHPDGWNPDVSQYGAVVTRFKARVRSKATHTWRDSLLAAERASNRATWSRIPAFASPVDEPSVFSVSYWPRDATPSEIARISDVWPYVEAQYHQTLTPDDIEVVIFFSRADARRLGPMLTERNIPWRVVTLPP